MAWALIIYELGRPAEITAHPTFSAAACRVGGCKNYSIVRIQPCAKTSTTWTRLGLTLSPSPGGSYDGPCLL